MYARLTMGKSKNMHKNSLVTPQEGRRGGKGGREGGEGG